MPVNAADVWHTSKVSQIYPHSNGYIVLVLAVGAPSCTSASTPDYYYIKVGENGVTQEGLENRLAVALTAATTDRAVSINFSDASAGCYVNRLLARFDSP